MRLVTYARVSTKTQSDRGASLADQEQRFANLLTQNPILERIAHYSEAKSAGTVEQRKTFVRMVEELVELRPDALVVDSLDRFTRDKFAGVEQFAKIRDAGVKLWELEYPEDRPLDLNNPADRDYVWKKFDDAEAERRRMQTRQHKRYRSDREKGHTTTNRPAFGLLRSEKRIYADPDRGWMIEEMDRRLVQGELVMDVWRWVRELDPKAWRSRRGFTLALENAAYVAAGLRTPETQAALLVIRAEYRARFGQSATEYEFTGVFACGYCVELGYPPEQSRMLQQKANREPTLSCQRRIGRTGNPRHRLFYVAQHKIEKMWRDAIERIFYSPGLLEKYFAATSPTQVRRSDRQLASLDQDLTRIQARADAAFLLLGDASPAVQRQARAQIEKIDREELAIHAQRQALLTERAPRRTRSLEVVRAALASYDMLYEGATISERNALNRELTSLLGYPILSRVRDTRRGPVLLQWSALEAQNQPDPAKMEHPREKVAR